MKDNRSDNAKMSLEYSIEKLIFMKLLINYSQILSLSKEINLSWTATIGYFLDAITRMSDISHQFFSFDCLLSSSKFSDNIILFKLILVFCFPLIVGFMLVINLFILRFFKRFDFKDNLIFSFIFVCYLIQPIIIYYAFLFISCTEIDPNKYYFSSYLATECYTQQYYLNVTFFFIIDKKFINY